MAEPKNIRLRGDEFAPKAASWQRATSAQRLQFWRLLGEVALRVKRDELRRGIGIDGDKFLPVKPRSRPDGATGAPLVPHYAESRTSALLATHVMVDGVTLYWKADSGRSWAKILGYHAYKRGARALPVRNTIGISPKGRKKIAGEAGAVWRRVSGGHSSGPKPRATGEPLPVRAPLPRPRPAAARALAPKPAPAPAPAPKPGIVARVTGALKRAIQVVFLGKGRPSAFSKKIQVHEK